MKLELGMYVRTKKGIAKIVKKFDKDNEPYDKAKYRTDTFLEIYYDSEYIGDADIIGEPSHNIIDLIEVGDYVNGEKVTRIRPPYILGDEELDCAHISSLNGEEVFEDIEIKSIVTKEQFESMSYKVGE